MPVKEYQDLLKELRTETFGHGAFGERESYPPSDLQLRAAKAIETLLAQSKQD